MSFPPRISCALPPGPRDPLRKRPVPPLLCRWGRCPLQGPLRRFSLLFLPSFFLCSSRSPPASLFLPFLSAIFLPFSLGFLHLSLASPTAFCPPCRTRQGGLGFSFSLGGLCCRMLRVPQQRPGHPVAMILGHNQPYSSSKKTHRRLLCYLSLRKWIDWSSHAIGGGG